jgi:DMSO reductase anchor subunit
MIYASLPTIRAWHQPLVAPVYVMLALATGGVLLILLFTIFGHDTRTAAIAMASALTIGAILKRLYWTAIDTARKTYTAEAATGLRGLGTVRPLDPPHTQPNFVMREMGYQVARRHAVKLRGLSAMLLFLLPLAAMLLLLLDPPQAVKLAIAVTSTLSATIGVLMERWLFFAEAEHVVMVYYRGGAA